MLLLFVAMQGGLAVAKYLGEAPKIPWWAIFMPTYVIVFTVLVSIAPWIWNTYIRPKGDDDG